ncbi:MAG: histidinol-phosphate transaminase [Actinomycetota bacterium]|nr:histidinol-phosphate transaminase [Actinomycetota bacterium]
MSPDTSDPTGAVGSLPGSPVPVREDIRLMAGYHSPQVEAAVRLNTNESPFAPPGAWLRELQAELASVPFNRYPDRSARELRSALARFHDVTPEQVFCGNGSNEVIQCLLLAFGGPGRSVAVFEPTYAMHSHIARLTGTRVIAGRRDEEHMLDREDAKRIFDEHSPELVFLCSPNNPTGRVETRETVEWVLECSRGLVVVDEAYGQFAPWSALSLISSPTFAEMEPVRNGAVGSKAARLVVTRTFSKTWAMAAARLGYLIGHAGVVSACQEAALPYHLDAVKQLAGRLALEWKAEMDERIAMVVQERGRLLESMRELGLRVWPSDANFILFKPLDCDGRVLWEGLLERSVLVRDLTAWPELKGCLRVTVGTRDENSAFLAAVRECLG